MKHLIFIALAALLMGAALTLPGCAADNQNQDNTQQTQNGHYNGADRRADPGNASVGNGAYGENP